MIAISNKKAKRDFSLQKIFTAGISLNGSEVKSVRSGKAQLKGSVVLIRGCEAFLVSADIPAHQPQNVVEGYDSKRPRKLLLTRKELTQLKRFTDEKKLTLIPVSIYNKGRYLKLDIGVGRKNQTKNKKEFLKERDIKRELKTRL